VPLETLMVKIEGPYGIPLAYEDKAAVLLIAGGVGITPIHGLFRSMYKKALSQSHRSQGGSSSSSSSSSSTHRFPDLIRLVWVAPDSIVFDVFLDTLLAVVHDDLDGRFSFKLYDSKAYRPGLTRGECYDIYICICIL
jgi:ferredoxin-NADP reductase